MKLVIFSQTVVKIALIVAILLFLGMVGFFLINYRQLPPQIPIFYSRPWGKEQLAPPLTLLILPAMSLLVLGLNLFLASFLEKYPLLTQTLIWTAVLFSFLAFFTFIRIVLVII